MILGTREVPPPAISIWVAEARPKALPMADGQTIGKLRLPLPPALRDF